MVIFKKTQNLMLISNPLKKMQESLPEIGLFNTFFIYKLCCFFVHRIKSQRQIAFSDTQYLIFWDLIFR